VACYQLGRAHEQGEVVAKDVARACHDLGARLLARPRSAQDLAETVNLHDKACAGGDPSGCLALARLYAKGKYLFKDLPRAAELYEEACEGGAIEGCTRYA